MSLTMEDLESRLLHLDAEKDLLEALKKEKEESKEATASPVEKEAPTTTTQKKMKVTLLSGFLEPAKRLFSSESFGSTMI